MPRDFPVTPAPAHAGWLLAALLLIPGAIIVVSASLVAPPAGKAAMLGSHAVGLLILVAIGAWTFWGLGRRRVRLDRQQLVVQAAMFSHRLDAGTLDLQRARIVDLDERIELRPVLKTFGMALPGFQAGWFMLKDRSRAFCLVTSRRRVLWLPKRAGGSLLLSLERPDSLLDALRGISSASVDRRS